MDPEKFACGFVINFSDGGPEEQTVLHVGTQEECEKLEKLVAAVSYSGGRPDPMANFIIVPYSD